MVRVTLAILGLAAAEDPTRPHLAQAWTAQSVGDGMEGVVGQESYLVVGNEAHHLWDYGSQGSKLWTCTNNADCRVYYKKLQGPSCCYCDDVEKPKVWDIDAKDTLFHKAAFVGFEDTTELNDNPVKGAEHWREDSKVFGVNVSYSYYLHREDNGDVISHRIDFGAMTTTQGSILYGDFQVAHDIDEHRKNFDVPEVCKGNILTCCDSMDEVDRKYDFHSYMIRQAQKATVAPGDTHHYGAPPCLDDEIAGDLEGGGSLCAAECDDQGGCPTDFPEDMSNPEPQCILQDQDTGKQYCGLTCGLGGGDCPSAASCSSPLIGVCVYPSGNTVGAHMKMKASVAV